ncbi:MAG: DUF2516 family protein [Dermabacter sp.]|nr:DUF2516 family protein [Dermabacter sp.]
MTFSIVLFIHIAFAVALVCVEAWALINALRFPAAAYDAAFKRTKNFWIGMTAGALVLGIITTPFGPGVGVFTLILSVVALVMAGVFLADVLPALRSVMGRAQGNYRRF